MNGRTDVVVSLTERFHGRGGPLGVTPVPLSTLSQQFVRAGLQLGYSIIDNVGPEQLGEFDLLLPPCR